MSLIHDKLNELETRKNELKAIKLVISNKRKQFEKSIIEIKDLGLDVERDIENIKNSICVVRLGDLVKNLQAVTNTDFQVYIGTSVSHMNTSKYGSMTMEELIEKHNNFNKSTNKISTLYVILDDNETIFERKYHYYIEFPIKFDEVQANDKTILENSEVLNKGSTYKMARLAIKEENKNDIYVKVDINTLNQDTCYFHPVSEFIEALSKCECKIIEPNKNSSR